MAKNITGLTAAHDHLKKLMDNREYNEKITQADVNFALAADTKNFKISRRDNNRVRRVKIVHVDGCWDVNHALMPKDVIFGSSQSMAINESRLAAADGEFDPLHGTACISAIQLNTDHNENPIWPLCSNEELLWHLADFAEIVLVPVRDTVGGDSREDFENAFATFTAAGGMQVKTLQEFLKLLNNTKNKAAKDAAEDYEFVMGSLRPYLKVIDLYKESKRITDALDEIIQLKLGGVLEHGDVVVVTIQNDLIGEYEHSLPIIHSPWVEEKVKELTNTHGLTVIIPAGNAGMDLGHCYYPRFHCKTNPEMEAAEKKLFRNNGVSCGAILIGADSANEHSKTINHGPCIDVYGRCAVTVPDPSGLPIPDELYTHWKGSSIASMIAAAVVASVQQIRFAIPDENTLPLKPYEARAHIRQWKHLDASNTPCNSDIMGSPPDVCAWLEGTAILKT